jgi:haloalkane dehalogenase
MQTAGHPHLPAPEWLEIGPHRLAYRRAGHGPDLVFIHGWPLHSATFRAIVPLLAADYTCHLLDLPSAGLSQSAAGADRGFRSTLGVVSEAIDRLGLQRYAFVAHDSGGMLARHIAAGDARVAGLVLGDTELPGFHPPALRMLSLLAQSSLGPSVLRTTIRIGALRRSTAVGFGGAFADLSLLDGEFFELFLAPVVESNAATARTLEPIRDYRALVDELAGVHARIRAPVQLIWGTHDPVFPLSRAREMAKQFAGDVRLDTLEGGKLFAHEEQPERFAQIARTFLQAVLATGHGVLSTRSA